MPKTLDGKRLTAKEHSIWKAVFDDTGNGGMATAAVQKYRGKKSSVGAKLMRKGKGHGK